MSIFEPIPRGSGGVHVEDDDDEDDGFPASGGSFDPRSIGIAGGVVAGIVVLGLLVSNTAGREPEPRPLMPSVQVDPGAAAVEQYEATQAARRPTTAPTASPSPTPDATADAGRIEPVGIDDAPEGPTKDDRKGRPDDKPGHGNGRGRG